jgi:hypothetical protein
MKNLTPSKRLPKTSTCPICGAKNGLTGYGNPVCEHVIMQFNGRTLVPVKLTPAMESWMRDYEEKHGYGGNESKTPLSDFRAVFPVVSIGIKVSGTYYNILYPVSNSQGA